MFAAPGSTAATANPPNAGDRPSEEDDVDSMHIRSTERRNPPRTVRPAGVRAVRLIALALVAGFVAAHSVSCTILLPMIADGSGSGSARVVPANQLFEVEPGATMQVSDGDGAVVEGRYLGLSGDSDSAYAIRYTAFLDSATRLALPHLGDTVRFTERSFRRQVEVKQGRFEGFDYRGVLVVVEGANRRRFEMTRLDSLWREDGRGVSGAQLAVYDADHALPSRTMLVIQTSAHDRGGRRRTHRQLVPWESVRFVQAASPNSGVGQAFVAGLLIDAAIIIWVSQPRPEPQPTGCDVPPVIFMSAGPSAFRHVRAADYDFDRWAGVPITRDTLVAAR